MPSRPSAFKSMMTPDRKSPWMTSTAGLWTRTPGWSAKLAAVPCGFKATRTPSCECGETTVFVAQLECHGGGGINFGDAGAGYAFVCPRCSHSAKFLWQCG